jgi:hypothetical protein
MARDPRVADLTGVTAYRYSNYDTPLWARPNTESGRWHTVGQPATQYFCLHPDGAWADLVRAENLRSEPEIEMIRTVIWSAMVSEAPVVDYSTFEKAVDQGFVADALVDDDHARCREEGSRLRDLGFQGILAPSAALPGTLNLTLFGPRVLAAWGTPPKLASSIPVCALARGAPASTNLTQRVRYQGSRHTDLVAYRAKS